MTLLGIYTMLKNSKIAQVIIAVLVAIAGVLTYGKFKKVEGRKEEKEHAKKEDVKNAENIRKRTDAVNPTGVRTDRGFRD